MIKTEELYVTRRKEPKIGDKIHCWSFYEGFTVVSGHELVYNELKGLKSIPEHELDINNSGWAWIEYKRLLFDMNRL